MLYLTSDPDGKLRTALDKLLSCPSVTDTKFRELALSFPGAEPGSHFGSADFRIKKRIFAGLSADGKIGNVKLRPETQEILISAKPKACYPCEGAWGRAGWTYLVLAQMTVAEAHKLLAEAHELVSTRRK